MKNKRKSHVSVVGYIGFFVMVAFIITCAILIFSVVQPNTANDAVLAGIMLAVIFALTAICTVLDWIRRRFTIDKSVAQISEAANKIANGDFAVRLKPRHPYGKYDEYDYIMQDINKMAEELSHNEVLKTDFISNVSHEIKTPLTIISNYATLLQDTNLSEEERTEYTKTLLSAARHLKDLVANILKLNKLENQVIQEQKTELNLGAYVSEIVLGFEEILDKKQLELDCDIDDIVCFADKTFIEIICNNLVSNAIKFTDNGGKISISLKDCNDYIKFAIADTGCGMPPEIGEHIFEKFYQGDTSRKMQGNGLGLALVKKVIDIIGGEISVTSQVGKGTEFTVKFKK